MDARYAFRLRLRVDPERDDVSLEPATIETRCFLEAPEPGTEGWLFFRDALWRGEVGDEAHARDLFTETVGVPVESVSFTGLHADEAYLDALKESIAADLDAFNADDVTEVLSKYLGSSVQLPGDPDG